MVKVILFALNALQAAAVRSSAKAGRKQLAFKKARAKLRDKRNAEAEAVEKQAAELTKKAERLRWEAQNHDAASIYGSVYHIRHQRQADELAASINKITVR